MTATAQIPSPIGTLTLSVMDGCLTGLQMEEQRNAAPIAKGTGRDALLADVISQLDAYFTGRLTQFDIPLSMEGTAFQRSVWAGLCEIPYGQTRSYGDLAKAIGNPLACRAVGLANGRNPIAIIVPCHRVIGANGTLTGFGGGLERKRWLLDHERQSVQGVIRLAV